jgi:hypothetical protein
LVALGASILERHLPIPCSVPVEHCVVWMKRAVRLMKNLMKYGKCVVDKKKPALRTSNVDFAFTLGLYNYNTKGGCLQRNISR